MTNKATAYHFQDNTDYTSPLDLIWSNRPITNNIPIESFNVDNWIAKLTLNMSEIDESTKKDLIAIATQYPQNITVIDNWKLQITDTWKVELSDTHIDYLIPWVFEWDVPKIDPKTGKELRAYWLNISRNERIKPAIQRSKSDLFDSL